MALLRRRGCWIYADMGQGMLVCALCRIFASLKSLSLPRASEGFLSFYTQPRFVANIGPDCHWWARALSSLDPTAQTLF